ncbi:hypothetical protein M0804_013662 [Polistes exclamans]|nr:hypothetical protein M0804_013662 [Polistes exclamans]
MEFMRPGEHMLDYFSRIKELTQSTLDESTKSLVQVERRVELAIEREGLDALIRNLPRDYKTALKFEYYSNFDEILICLLKIDKQIKEEDSKMGILRTDGKVRDDKKRNVSFTFGNPVANIRQIKENVACEHCHKTGHKWDDCFRETVCNYCQKQGYPENRCFKKKRDNSNMSGRTSPNDSTSQTKTGYKSPKKCSYSPCVTATSPRLREAVTLMIDAGADINLIKIRNLAKRTVINTKRIVQLTGISPDTQKTLGTVELIIFGERTIFHAVENHFPISADGIIGNELLRSTPTNIDYIREVLIVKNRRIPFTVGDKVSIPPRTLKVIFCHVINADVKDGYISRIQLPKGVYAGEALVGNVDGRAYFRLINKTSRFVLLQIPKLELLAYNIGTLPSLQCDCYKSTSEVENLNECLHTLYNIFESPCADLDKTSESQ